MLYLHTPTHKTLTKVVVKHLWAITSSWDDRFSIWNLGEKVTMYVSLYLPRPGRTSTPTMYTRSGRLSCGVTLSRLTHVPWVSGSLWQY